MLIAEQVLHQHFPESRFTPGALDVLKRCEWPGNVRQLKNTIFKAVMTAPHAEIELRECDLPVESRIHSSSAHLTESVNLYELEKRTILQVVETTGNAGAAAEQLGISRRTSGEKT